MNESKNKNHYKNKKGIEMKKLISITFILIFLVSAFSIMPAAAPEGTKIRVYNWGEYIPDGKYDYLDINKEFTRRTGIEVDYINYSSNEDLYAKLNSGGAAYDIIIPSDYMIERLIKEEKIQKIDFNNIPNYKYIGDDYKNLPYDPENEYSVPYTAGLVGIIYNTKIVQGTPDSWGLLWNEAYKKKILNFDNPRDAFATAQFLLNIDVNSTDLEQWNTAAEKIKDQIPLLQKFVMDDIFNLMEKGEASIAPYYSGDYYTMKKVNPDLEFFYPKEGTNFFVDAICIPKDAPNKAGAEAYINFLLDPDIALEIAEYLNYMSPNTAVLENDDYTYKGDKLLYPGSEVMEKAVLYRHLPAEVIDHMQNLWDDIKLADLSVRALIICFIVVFVIVIVLIIFKAYQKKKREAE